MSVNMGLSLLGEDGREIEDVRMCVYVCVGALVVA